VPHVVSIASKAADAESRPAGRFSRIAVGRAELVAGHGLAGDAKARPDSRQLNVMLAETVEQLVLAGLPADSVAPGVRLRLGGAEALATPPEQWCYFLKHGATLDADRLPAPLDNPTIRQALEVLVVVSQSELDRHRYEDRLKAERDAASLRYAAEHAHEHGFEEGREKGHEQGRAEGLQEGRQAGLQEGRQEGIQEGRQVGLQQGQLAGRIRLCQQMLGQPQLSDDDVLRFSIEQLTELAGQLELQVLAGRQPPG
jgi:hypothetical protein